MADQTAEPNVLIMGTLGVTYRLKKYNFKNNSTFKYNSTFKIPLNNIYLFVQISKLFSLRFKKCDRSEFIGGLRPPPPS